MLVTVTVDNSRVHINDMYCVIHTHTHTHTNTHTNTHSHSLTIDGQWYGFSSGVDHRADCTGVERLLDVCVSMEEK